MKKTVIIATSDKAIILGKTIQKEFPKSLLVTTRQTGEEHVSQVDNFTDFLNDYFHKADKLIFISSLGICVRLIAPFIKDKYTDPAVVTVDDHGLNVQSVLSGHVGEANILAKKISSITGGNAIISTSSDLQDIWALDTLGRQLGWKQHSAYPMNELVALFVNNKPTALLVEVKTKETEKLIESAPEFVSVFYSEKDVVVDKYELLIYIGYRKTNYNIPQLSFYPPVLHLGSGCSKELTNDVFVNQLKDSFVAQGLAFEALAGFGSIDIKAKQSAYLHLAKTEKFPFTTFTAEELNRVEVPNPSDVVKEKIGVDGVSEAVALLLSGNDHLLIEKQKVLLENGEKFTYAIALTATAERKSSIAIVGAGPGDEELVTVKGKALLENADCVLYAGSLIPEEMLNWCQEGAVVRNSASMTLEEQIDLMKTHYEKGHSIVRLHSGDPSIYGAIQEQMSVMDELGMDYYIVPGISSFNAAAAVLKSEFTIPEEVQTIVLTRGEGKTPMPAAEKINEMARIQATMCLFLSAGIAKKVEAQLLEHYAPDTPVAVLYRLTWKDEEVYTGKLENLAEIIKKSKKTRTVLIIVGKAIGARKNRSQLYSHDWEHIFRTHKKHLVKA